MTFPDEIVEMKVTVLADGLIKVALAGRLDTSGVDRIETRFGAAVVAGSNNAVIDVSRITFIASMGIRMLITVARSMRPRKTALAVYGAQPLVAEVFESVSLNDLIPIVETEAEATAAVGR